jgi:hypothetical protein
MRGGRRRAIRCRLEPNKDMTARPANLGRAANYSTPSKLSKATILCTLTQRETTEAAHMAAADVTYIGLAI